MEGVQGAHWKLMVEFKYIAPFFLDEVWNDIEPDLEKLSTRYSEDWKPSDVYKLIKASEAWLYLIYRDDKYLGFCALEVLLSQFTKDKYINVWILCCEEFDSFSDDGVKELDRIAKQIGAISIRLITQRPGWDKKLKNKFPKRIITMERHCE